MPTDPTDPSLPDWLYQQRLDVGTRVREARRRARLSQEQLAERIGTERRTVVRIELGITSPPLDRILHIARALDVTPASLLPAE